MRKEREGKPRKKRRGRENAHDVAHAGSPAPQPDNSIRLSFMVAGVQKGGTTSLYEVLRQHPEIGMSRKKEPHFFDTESFDWKRPTYRPLHLLLPPGRPICGEATPVTLFWRPAHRRIRAYNPQMKFILLFRDPVERAYSHWCMQFARKRETRSFAQSIRGEAKRSEMGPRAYVARGFYADQLEALLRLFPRENLLCLLSEEFRDHPDAVKEKVGEFLGVDPGRFPAEHAEHMKRPDVDYPSAITNADREWLRGAYAFDLARFAKLTGLDIGRWSAVSA